MVDEGGSSKMSVPGDQIMQCSVAANVNHNFYILNYVRILFRMLPFFMHPLTK